VAEGVDDAPETPAVGVGNGLGAHRCGSLPPPACEPSIPQRFGLKSRPEPKVIWDQASSQTPARSKARRAAGCQLEKGAWDESHSCNCSAGHHSDVGAAARLESDLAAEDSIPSYHPRHVAGPGSFLSSKAGDERPVVGIKLCWCPAGRFIIKGWSCRAAFQLPLEPERQSDPIGFRVVAVQQ
jgi:hypothetical protein